MRIKKMNRDFFFFRVADYTLVNLNADYCFIEKTEEENSLVCMTEDVPANTTEREDGWKAFRIEGVLDFSLIGILAGIAGVLAEHGISIFAVSTYNTDYVLIKRESYGKALEILGGAGYEIVE